jgi:hypothetical protein
MAATLPTQHKHTYHNIHSCCCGMVCGCYLLMKLNAVSVLAFRIACVLLTTRQWCRTHLVNYQIT